MEKDGPKKDASPAQLIDARIEELGDWRGEMLSLLRDLIRQVDPEVVEEWKWRGVPVWYHDGMICTGETYKSHVKVTFANGAALEDPSGLFNSGLDGNTRRACDLPRGRIDRRGGVQGVGPRGHQPERVLGPRTEGDSERDDQGWRTVMSEGAGDTAKKVAKKAAIRPRPRAGKADGEAEVLANIAAMPSPDRALAERLHAIIMSSAPGLSPRLWYGMPAYAKDG